jgi:hypothetical protein
MSMRGVPKIAFFLNSDQDAQQMPRIAKKQGISHTFSLALKVNQNLNSK